MRETTIKDDLTGNPITDATETTLAINGKSGSVKLDLGPDALAALTALANGEGASKLWALAPAPAAPAKSARKPRKSAASGNAVAADGSDAEAVRAWCREHGVTVSERGRVNKDAVKAYDAAHAASGPESPATAPAATPAATGKPSGSKSLASV